MTRLAFGIEYDGTDFLGWQSQLQQPTLQDTVAAALSFVADEPMTLVCAGRTDTGVHARCQVLHCDTDAQRTERAWVLGANSRLPSSVCVRWAKPVDDDFHARYSAQAREYRYRILNRPVRLALDARMATWERVPLDVPAMQKACDVLLGTHDFSAFGSPTTPKGGTVRTIMKAEWLQAEQDEWHFEVQADAFLYRMVRRLVFVQVAVAQGKLSAEAIARSLVQQAKAGAEAKFPRAWLLRTG